VSTVETLDLLAVMAHPDDAELLCGGTLIKAATAGKRVGILDLTGGEMGSSGSRSDRQREAARAAEIMGLTERRSKTTTSRGTSSRAIYGPYVRASSLRTGR
jgi:LmbE family N-acetylglucosaminyl deacetylase